MDRTWRYERKFYSEAIGISNLYQMVRANPYGFYEEFPERMINNIYYDTEMLSLYKQHIAGSPNRKKVRIRWYGQQPEEFIPILEIKIKEGLVNYKEKFPLKAVNLEEWRKERFSLQYFDNKAVSGYKEFSPKIYNSYNRKYFRSLDKKFRITLDFRLRFGEPGKARYYESGDTIMEFKYAEEHDSVADRVTQYFPQRLGKYSKYVKAIESVYQIEQTQEGRVTKLN